MLETIEFLNSISELSRSEKNLQTSLKFGENYNDIEVDLLEKAKEEILCADWCLWETISSQHREYQDKDSFDMKVIFQIDVTGVLSNVGKQTTRILIDFARSYHGIVDMTWQSMQPQMFSAYGTMIPVPQGSMYDRISFKSSFIFDRASKKLQDAYMNFLKNRRGYHRLQQSWT